MRWPWSHKKGLNGYYEMYLNQTVDLKALVKKCHRNLPESSIEEKIVDSLKRAIAEALSEEKEIFDRIVNDMNSLSFPEKVKEMLFFLQQRYPDMANPIARIILDNIMHSLAQRAIGVRSA